MTYPDKLEIIPLSQPPTATIAVPGSKSITNRALVLAALSDDGDGGELQGHGGELRGALDSEDTHVMVDALKALGFQVEVNWPEAVIRVRRTGTELIPARNAELFVGNSGTSMRFLTAMLSLGHGRYRLDGVPRMRERPIEDLLAALQQLGVKAYSEKGNGCPPVIVEANGLAGGTVKVKGDISSQFLSGLLLAAPLADNPLTIEVDGPLVSRPYVDMTVAMLRQWFRRVEVISPRRYLIPGRQHTALSVYRIEPDASAASYFFAAAAILSGEVTVPALSMESLQGDVLFIQLLEKMGCTVGYGRDHLTVSGGLASDSHFEADMNYISDTVMTLAAVACFAEGPTTIRNVAHIRHKETDRLAAVAAELRKVGAKVEEFPDGLTITPGPLHGAEIDTYNDHRMAMSMALIGLKVPGIVIKNPGCVAKTYPGFWTDLEKLRQTN